MDKGTKETPSPTITVCEVPSVTKLWNVFLLKMTSMQSALQLSKGMLF